MRNFVSEHSDSKLRHLNDTAVLRRRTPFEEAAYDDSEMQGAFSQQIKFDDDTRGTKPITSPMSRASTQQGAGVKTNASTKGSPTDPTLSSQQPNKFGNSRFQTDVTEDLWVSESPAATPARVLGETRFELRNEAEENKINASHPLKWFHEAKANMTTQQSLQIGVVLLVLVVLLGVLAAVWTGSGAPPDRTFPRLVFFFVDGVSVDEFKSAAALRHIPSMEYFASQSYNCRPDVPMSSPDATTDLLDQCTMTDKSSGLGTMFSLLTGEAFSTGVPASSASSSMMTLSALKSRNFTTFLSLATKLGLSTAILGNTPLLSVPVASVDGGGETPQQRTATHQVECGMIELECQHIAAGQPGVRVPDCIVPARAGAPPSQMITRSSSCNSAYKSLISEEDTPQEIWERLEYLMEFDADVILVQIPEKTMKRWTELHLLKSGGGGDNDNQISAEEEEENRKDALDAALYSVDGIFSNLVRATAMKSARDSEQWLTLLSFSKAPSDPNILMVSNIFDAGRRKDVPFIHNVWKLTPDRLFTVISDWLRH